VLIASSQELRDFAAYVGTAWKRSSSLPAVRGFCYITCCGLGFKLLLQHCGARVTVFTRTRRGLHLRGLVALERDGLRNVFGGLP